MHSIISGRLTAALGPLDGFYRFVTDSAWARRANDPGIADFAFGNPHEMPLADLSGALARASVARNKDWFAYKRSEPESREFIAGVLRERNGLPFDAEDIHMTTGAFGAIATALDAFVEPGDEVIYISPPWFFYAPMVEMRGGRAVGVAVDRRSFDLDLAAIEAAIGPRTRMVIVNSPHNPTGKIYPGTTLQQLGEMLLAAGERYGRPILLLADESYNRIVFDGRDCPSAVAYYPWTLLVYTYGKTLLTPGQRIGYLAVPPTMPGREELRGALMMAQVLGGWLFPNALLQHALPELDKLSIDVAHLQRKRDRMVAALSEIGYDVSLPEGTFYLVVRSPWEDDDAFCELLAEHDVLCMPGSIFELPGYFRISLTANDEMIDRALPGFATAINAAGPV